MSSRFTSGEGCFNVFVHSSSTNYIGFQISLRFQITQHKRDEMLMNKIMEYLDCGYVVRREEAFYFKVTKFSDLDNKIVPFLKNIRSVV